MAKNQSTEDYLKGIYKLQHNGKGVATSELAKHLKIGDGSVTGMIKKLAAKRLVHHTPYKGVSLTASGKRLAVQMIRRHRLWEMFLVKFLGYRWDEIHDEAERLEHVTSQEMERRLDKALGYPKVDPHGDPIPTMNGEFDGTAYSPLSEFEVGDRVKIIRVDDDQGVLQLAATLGLGLNKNLTVKEKMKFDGSMIVKVGPKEQFISQRIAKSIFVRVV
ncbi:MAG: metal-dependent transcriptional regulator [Ignavibacteria bacterium]|nr:metal-dependent transcriptional regulator [Ignavibacteria bacterium]